MVRNASLVSVLVLISVLVVSALTVKKLQGAGTGPKVADPDFAVQGEYVGQKKTEKGPIKYGVQVIALGGGRFRAVCHRGGLPGAGWDKSEKMQADGQTAEGVTTFAGEDFRATLKDGTITVKDNDGQTTATFKKVYRKSPTLGAKPPAGAVVLFDGKTADNFKNGRMTEDGLLKEGATSKQNFQSFTLHMEFRTPFTPKAGGQGRGNSGFYAQGRYEVQILDSFGLRGRDNECGGIYKVAQPKVNMCLPPMSWQTYDVEFTAAQFKDDKKVKNATITVLHNGVPIHEKVELPRTTAAGIIPNEGPQPGPVFLQNHGNPVRFCNIWVLEKK